MLITQHPYFAPTHTYTLHQYTPPPSRACMRDAATMQWLRGSQLTGRGLNGFDQAQGR